MSKSKTEFHLDILEQEIRHGSFVVANYSNGDLQVCIVDSLTPKMVKVKKILDNSNFYPKLKTKYPKDLCVINNSDAITMFILKNAGKNAR